MRDVNAVPGGFKGNTSGILAGLFVRPHQRFMVSPASASLNEKQESSEFVIIAALLMLICCSQNPNLHPRTTNQRSCRPQRWAQRRPELVMAAKIISLHEAMLQAQPTSEDTTLNVQTPFLACQQLTVALGQLVDGRRDETKTRAGIHTHLRLPVAPTVFPRPP